MSGIFLPTNTRAEVVRARKALVVYRRHLKLDLLRYPKHIVRNTKSMKSTADALKKLDALLHEFDRQK